MNELTRERVQDVPYDHPAAVALRTAMQEEMGRRYADRLDELPAGMAVQAESVLYTGVIFDAETPVGHVLLRRLDGEVELKRMYVAPSHRGSGVASALLAGAEDAARRLGARRIILQTGDRQPDAVRLYEREGYTRIPIYAPYTEMAYSTCFEKPVNTGTYHRVHGGQGRGDGVGEGVA
ncbi:GNAT family N-acetyltransferase [Nonomuraea sp. NPDC050556]|uniref:GNAT family N-acetyltransferase n=1 Tax=Nonomuraea sp. NPDC050556 TaxID=3364369 RepID=UPI0037923079